MKKILIGALTAIMLLGFGVSTEASQPQYDEQCRGGYCARDGYASDGDYDGRHGCYGGGYGCYR